MNASLDKLRRAAVLIGWTALLVIIVSTLSPIDARPHLLNLGPDVERFLAYLAAGALLTFAYPRQRWLVLPGLVALAAGLEWLQTLEMTRHGLPHDALVKIMGAVIGSAMASSFEYMLRRFRNAF
ncbi:VanZ family protein [Bosea sp. TAF32]|uniref:VanZ family protein n=1 Tax=Bosea sp. TAF32 TaxID=3237482 RepID=UPI003F91725D